MKKIIALLMMAVMMLALTGCGGDKKDEKKADTKAPIKIGVTAGPHAEIMDNVKKHVINGWEVDDLLTKLSTLLGIGQTLVVSLLLNTYTLSCNQAVGSIREHPSRYGREPSKGWHPLSCQGHRHCQEVFL